MKKLLIGLTVAAATTAVTASTAVAAPAPAKSANLTIVHVQNGCHIFNGTQHGATVHMSLPRGGVLTIVNQDIDGHRLLQASGPQKLKLGAMKMNGRLVLTFAKRGAYTFTTKTFELAGMPDVKTMGMDNNLKLVVNVR